MCILKCPVYVLHVVGFTTEQEAQCIVTEKCTAKTLVAEVNSQGSIVHKIKL